MYRVGLPRILIESINNDGGDNMNDYCKDRVPMYDKLAYIKYLEANDLAVQSDYVSKLEARLKIENLEGQIINNL